MMGKEVENQQKQWKHCKNTEAYAFLIIYSAIDTYKRIYHIIVTSVPCSSIDAFYLFSRKLRKARQKPVQIHSRKAHVLYCSAILLVHLFTTYKIYFFSRSGVISGMVLLHHNQISP